MLDYDDDDDEEDGATEAWQPSQPRSRDRARTAGCRNMAGIVLRS